LKKSLLPKQKRRSAASLGAATDESGPRAANLFPVVGVGASAGGLEAFSCLLADLPETTRMAFVFVQHLDPTHTSALEEILSRSTRIPVTEVKTETPVESNHIYVIPPNADLTIRSGVLHLSPRSLGRGQHRPIDSFLHSLAEDCGDRCIAVILSGTATDGTSGCLAVKAVGGITFAQDDATAKHTGMPRSATEAGCVDFVLPPRGIAEELARIEKHPYIARVPTRQGELRTRGDSRHQRAFHITARGQRR
jgi:two-component system CheB/CheR fusion protein